MTQNGSCRVSYIKQANKMIGSKKRRTIVRTQIRKKFKFREMRVSVSRARISFLSGKNKKASGKQKKSKNHWKTSENLIIKHKYIIS